MNDELQGYLQDPTLDPETQPEPYFDGLSIDQIWSELDRLEQAAWEEQWLNQMWHEENTRWGD